MGRFFAWMALVGSTLWWFSGRPSSSRPEPPPDFLALALSERGARPSSPPAAVTLPGRREKVVTSPAEAENARSENRKSKQTELAGPFVPSGPWPGWECADLEADSAGSRRSLWRQGEEGLPMLYEGSCAEWTNVDPDNPVLPGRGGDSAYSPS